MAKQRFFFGVLVVVGAIGYLIYTGIRETSNYYLTIEEFLPQKDAFANEGIRLAGRVQTGSVQWDPKDLRLSFMLGPFEAKEQLDTLPGLRVNYQGILPDMFAEGRDIIVEGKYENGQSLIAKTIMTRCPSKYEPEKPETQAKATNP